MYKKSSHWTKTVFFATAMHIMHNGNQYAYGKDMEIVLDNNGKCEKIQQCKYKQRLLNMHIIECLFNYCKLYFYILKMNV